MDSEQPGISNIPDELVEEILIACVADDATSIAAVAATCRRLYSIIYNTTDHHLWRSLFLTLFDDPRGHHRRPALEPDWRKDLEERVWTNRFFTRHAQPIRIQHIRSSQPALCYTHPPALTSDSSEHLRALKTVLTVMYTARLDPDLRPMGTPPRAQALDVMDFGFETDTIQTFYAQPRGLWPPSVPTPQPSLNIAWLRNTISNGVRASPTGRVALDDIEVDEDWHETEEGLATGQIISHLGFLPIPTVESDVEPVAETEIEMQRKRAHWYARQRVFDFDYLSRKRRWGPYLPVHPKKARPHPAVDHIQPAEDSDSDDSQWLPGTDAPGAARVPPARLLRPDWSWLAAARIVAECTLRRAHRKLGLEILGAWDNVREGTWVPTCSVDGDSAESFDSNTRASQSTSVRAGKIEGSCKTLHGHDWAGVEGVWRRLVCWLGYTDLIYHYENGKYDDPDLHEVYIILSLSLRITGYSPSSISACSDRPDIHVEGEMSDAGGEGNVFLGAYNPRRVHGTVSMLTGGSVRYSFVSTNEDNTGDQWASEAIQLGGIGSAMGALGMWTGVNHEDDDPLGVIWQWRVD